MILFGLSMKFIATIGDSKAVDIFIKVVGLVSKLCKKQCVIRITPTEFSFVNIYNLREGMHMDFRIHKDQLFTSWSFAGVSPPDNNAMFFSLGTDDLVHSLHTRESQIRMKLIKKDGVPHFRIELVPNSLVNELPLNIIPVSQWPDYGPPMMGQPHLAVSLPPIKTLARIVSGVRNMGCRHLGFRANNRGEFTIMTQTDMAKVAVFAQGLGNQSMSGLEDLSQTAYHAGHFFNVVLDIRIIHSFLVNVQNYVSRLTMKIIEGHGAILTANEPEFNFTLYLAGINQD